MHHCEASGLKPFPVKPLSDVALSFCFLASSKTLSVLRTYKLKHATATTHHAPCRKLHTIPRHNHLPSIRAYCCASLSDLALEGLLASRQPRIAAGLERQFSLVVLVYASYRDHWSYLRLLLCGNSGSTFS
jgi:hypothetical protein